MFVVAHILDTDTDELAIYDEDYDWPDEDGLLFQWTENNWACDCNRALFHSRALGRDDLDVVCGDDRFLIKKLVDRDTGRLIYSE